MQDELEGHSWGDLVTNLKSKKRAEELENQGQSVNTYDRTLLLGGCVNGMIVLFDWQNEKTPGKVTFQIEVRLLVKDSSTLLGIPVTREKSVFDSGKISNCFLLED